MNFADGLLPALIVEENPPCQAPAPAPAPASHQPASSPATARVAVAAGPGDVSPQWMQVLSAMDELRGSLNQHKVMESHPAIAHDFVAVMAALESLRGNALFEAYWRAQLERMLAQKPNIKDQPVPAVTSPGRGSVYAGQHFPGEKRQ